MHSDKYKAKVLINKLMKGSLTKKLKISHIFWAVKQSMDKVKQLDIIEATISATKTH